MKYARVHGPRFLPLEPHSKSFHFPQLHPSLLSLRWFLHERKNPSTVSELVWKSPACRALEWRLGGGEQDPHQKISMLVVRRSRDRQAEYLYESARCLQNLVKLPSRRAVAVSMVDLFLNVLIILHCPDPGKFQKLRCFRAWPHSVIHNIRCEPAHRWLADGLIVVGVPPKWCSKNLVTSPHEILHHPSLSSMVTVPRALGV